jgi:hypothetical protein
MTKFCSKLLPVVDVIVIIFCDIGFLLIQTASWDTHTISTVVSVIIFNILVFMALWSLFASLLSDPGYIPINYTYDESKFSKIVAQIFTFVK